MLDSLVQGSLVELFQAYGVAIAPLPRDASGRAPEGELSAAIGFTSTREAPGPRASGRLTLALPTGVFDMMRKNGAHSTRHADWARELVNQLIGRFKNRLLPFGVHLQAGLPSSLGPDVLDAQLRRANGLRVYRARTLRGDIVATLDGTLKEADLSYRGVSSGASEGDLIIF